MNNFNKHQNDKNKVNLVSGEDSLTQLDIHNEKTKSDSDDYINDSKEQINFLEVSSLDEEKETGKQMTRQVKVTIVQTTHTLSALFYPG
jgi:hypothetical protein